MREPDTHAPRPSDSAPHAPFAAPAAALGVVLVVATGCSSFPAEEIDLSGRSACELLAEPQAAKFGYGDGADASPDPTSVSLCQWDRLVPVAGPLVIGLERDRGYQVGFDQQDWEGPERTTIRGYPAMVFPDAPTDVRIAVSAEKGVITVDHSENDTGEAREIADLIMRNIT